MDPSLSENQKPTSAEQPKPGSSQAPSRYSQFDPPNATDDSYLFFNVMPKANSAADSLVQPTIKVVEQSGQEKPSGGKLPDFIKKYRRYILISVGALILLGIGYFAFVKLTAVKQENILNNSTTKTTPAPAATSSSPSVVTTSAAWQQKYFNNSACQDPAICGDAADPDRDGLTNKEEFALGTDPNNPDSDGDGLADGDEVHVFGSNPLSNHTGHDQKYTDSDYVKGGYDFKTDQKLTADQLNQITNKMKQYGLHEPTISTLGNLLISLYNFTNWTISNPVSASSTASSTLPTIASTTPASTSPLSGLDTSVSAEQDRDAQRSSAIQNIGMALLKYHADTNSYPQTSSFTDMYTAVKPYIKVATRPDDPVNKDPYVYTYQASPDGKDFTLSFYSEVADQVIKKHAADAQKDADNLQAGIYDDQRKTDLEMIKTALLLYSNKNVAGNQVYVFPTEDKYKTDLVPEFIPQLPKDPKTGDDYEYAVSDTFDTFTLKAILGNPSKGTTGYLCNQDECRNY